MGRGVTSPAIDRAPVADRPVPGPRSRAFRRAAAGVVLVLLVVAMAGSMLPARPALIFLRIAGPLAEVTSAAICLLTAARHRGAERNWRLLVGVMVLAIGLGSAAVLRSTLAGGQAVPHLSRTTLFILPPWAFGLAGLLCYPTEPYDVATRNHRRGRDWRWYLIILLDSVIVVGALGLLAWVSVLEKAAMMRGLRVDPLTAYLVTAAGTLMVVVVILTATFRRPRSPLGLGLLGGGILAYSCSVMIYLYAVNHELTDVPRVLDLGYVGGPLLVALAALVPTAGEREPGWADGAADAGFAPRRRWWHLFLPYLPLLAAGVVAIVRVAGEDLAGQEEIWVLLGLLLLALFRQVVTMSDNLGLLVRLEDNQRQLRHQAFHDPLTGLANRALFGDRLGQALARRTRDRRRVAVLFCDLDDFKHVNDALGHAAGDELLCITADRLNAEVRAADTVARYGGDEFAILLESQPRPPLGAGMIGPEQGSPGGTDGGTDGGTGGSGPDGSGTGGTGPAGSGPDDPETVGRRLVAAVRTPVQLAGTRYAVAASFGLVVAEPGDPDVSAETLLHRADLAMYAAKGNGLGSLIRYDPELSDPGTGPALHATLAGAARGDAAGGELAVHYQPIVSLRTGALAAYQAHLSWTHPQFGTLRPQQVLPATATVGLAPTLDRILLRRVCLDAAGLFRRDGRLDPVPVHVMISAARAAGESLVGDVTEALAEAGLPAGALVLDITATARAPDLNATARVLTRLDQAGVRIGLARVGTIDTTVDSLRLLPIELVEIDESFATLWVGSTEAGRAGRLTDAFLRAVLDLGIIVIADGVRDETTARRLLARGCQLGSRDLLGDATSAEPGQPGADAARPAVVTVR